MAAYDVSRGLPPEGVALGPYVVVAPRGDDIVDARDADGRAVVIAFGERPAIELEAHALRTVQHSAVPAVQHVGEHPTHGAYLAVLPAKPIEAPDDRSCVAALLEIARTIERAGYAWHPLPCDVSSDGVLLRLRGAVRLGANQRLDARSVVEALGPRIVDVERCLVPALLRVLLPRPPELPRTIDALAAELADVDEPPSQDDEVGASSDVGLARSSNEDAFVVRRVDHAILAVVCDGMSSSRDAHLASTTAARVAAEVLEELRGEPPASAMREAIRRAHEALCDLQPRASDALGTTLVAARIDGPNLTIAWVGDSRAYFVGAEDCRLLTRDHSWLAEALTCGTPLEEAMASPYAHALTRCLGPIEGGDAWHAEPDVVELVATTRGRLILCTDGVWHYASAPEEVARVVQGLGPFASCTDVARSLVAAALARGGHDNATAVVLSVANESDGAFSV